MQYRLGIDLGGTTFKVGLVNPTFQITAHKSAKTGPHARSAAALIADIASVSRALLSEAGLSPAALRTVGIGTPGRVNPKTGEVFAASNLGWSHVPFFSDIVCCLLSNVCVVTSFYQSLQAMSSFVRFSICATYCTLSSITVSQSASI